MLEKEALRFYRWRLDGTGGEEVSRESSVKAEMVSVPIHPRMSVCLKENCIVYQP